MDSLTAGVRVSMEPQNVLTAHPGKLQMPTDNQNRTEIYTIGQLNSQLWYLSFEWELQNITIFLKLCNHFSLSLKWGMI